MLNVADLETHYATSQALFGVSLEVAAGEVVTLLGRNGMGKTTTINSIMGIVRPSAGEASFEGTRISGLPSFRIAQRGLGLVPEGRQIFPNLTVRENLIATATPPRDSQQGWTTERVIELFPALGSRLTSMGNQLSGGEQQMLAIGRALMTNPRLLILDEATEGLAPLIRREIWRCLESLKAAAQSILPANLGTLYGLRNATSYDVLRSESRADLLSKGGFDPGGRTFRESLTAAEVAHLGTLGVRFVLSRDAVPGARRVSAEPAPAVGVYEIPGASGAPTPANRPPTGFWAGLATSCAAALLAFLWCWRVRPTQSAGPSDTTSGTSPAANQ